MLRICRARNYCAEGYEVSAYIKAHHKTVSSKQIVKIHYSSLLVLVLIIILKHTYNKCFVTFIMNRLISLRAPAY